jgi:hypothetical protein
MTAVRCAAGFIVWQIASPVCGQVIDRNGVPFRLWDFNVSLGIHAANPTDAGDRTIEPYDEWNASLLAEGGVGRYWTSHLKTEFSAAYKRPTTGYGTDAVPIPPGVANAFYQERIQLTAASVVGSYQFFENVFAHPYVSAGARIGIANVHKQRDPMAIVYSRPSVTYNIPALDTRDTVVVIRPIVAAGFKSYFDERAFVRSEVSGAFSGRGMSQFTLRLGFGVDF